MEEIVTTRELTRDYGRTRAVSNLNMSAMKGEIYGFLGRNGAGKTTTIKMLLGLIKPTSGTIQIFGKDAAENRNQILLRTGCMVEASGFYSNLTGRENLKIFTRLSGVHSRNIEDHVLELTGLGREAGKTVKKYSMGMKQRLGIARALLKNPDLLILDEPINGLDPFGIKEVRKLLTHLAEEKGVTVILSSHILNEIEQLADRIGIIHEGRLLEEIDYSEFLEKSRRYIKLTVSNPPETLRYLEREMGISSFEMTGKESLHIYEALGRTAEINSALVKNGIAVSELTEGGENLEQYFMKLTGGPSND